jgi:hypothetical protein
MKATKLIIHKIIINYKLIKLLNEIKLQLIYAKNKNFALEISLCLNNKTFSKLHIVLIFDFNYVLNEK